MHRAVIVELHARPDKLEEFVDLIERHGHNSRTLEEGCLAFDVCQDPDDPTVFVLYEVYQDTAAHAQHREMDSFKWFAETAPALCMPAADGTIFQSRRVLQRRPY